MKKEFKKAVVLLLAVTLISLYGISVSAEEVIKIGVTGPFTGPAAEAGIAIKQGTELAVFEWNEKGGIEVDGNMRKIEVLYEDCQSKPEVGVSVAEKLITRDKVDFLFGDAFHSSVTLAIMELSPKYNIPISTVECTSPEISKKVRSNPERYSLFWKGCFDSDAYGDAVFNTFKDLIDDGQLAPKSKTIAFVVEDTDYGRANAEVCKIRFNAVGWKALTVETVPLGHTDFYSQLYKLKTMNPDIIISCYTSLSSGVAFVKQFQEIGLKSNHMAIYYPNKSEFIEQAGEACEGLLWTPFFFDPETIDRQKPFAEKIKKKYNVKPTYDQLHGYEMMTNVLYAIQKAGSLKPKKIAEAMNQTDREGLLGRWVFDKNTHSIKAGEEYIPIPAGQIIDGKTYLVWPLKKATRAFVVQPWAK